MKKAATDFLCDGPPGAKGQGLVAPDAAHNARADFTNLFHAAVTPFRQRVAGPLFLLWAVPLEFLEAVNAAHRSVPCISQAQGNRGAFACAQKGFPKC